MWASQSNFLVDLFDMPVQIAGQEPMTLYEYVRDHTRQPWWSAVFGLPGKLVSLLKNEEEEDRDVPVDPYRLTMEQARVAKAIGSAIKATVEKKTLMITIETTMQNPVVAADLAVCSSRVQSLLKTTAVTSTTFLCLDRTLTLPHGRWRR